MKIRNLTSAVLFLAAGLIAPQSKAQFIKIDDFTNSVVGNLSGQTSDGPNQNVWGHVTSTASVIITNSATPGAGQPGSGTPLSPNAYAAATTSTDGAAVISLPVTIPTNSTQATVFMQFDMGPDQTADNVNWDLANAPGTDAGGGGNAVEMNANVPGRAGVTMRNNTFFDEMSADGQTVFTPLDSTIYNIWFVIDNASQSYVVYMQDANPNAPGADLPNLTRMQVGTGTAYASPPAGFTTNAIGFRNRTLLPLQVFIYGLGGSGDVTQYTYDIYEDPNSMDLTNPVTGVSPLFLSPPVIASEPQSEELYAGGTAVFSVAATGGGLSYQWQTNGVALADGGNISGSATATLTISDVSSANAFNYTCVITNVNTGAYQSTNTTAASLQIVSPGGAFETTLAASGPSHFYAFDDTGSPLTGTEVAFDYGGGDNGVYGTNAQNGFDDIAGPRPVPDGFPGFSPDNFAAAFTGFDEPCHVTVDSPWNLNTNAVTITAWINPTSLQTATTGLVFNEGGGTDIEGFEYSASGLSTLGYIWNDDSGTSSWDSTLQPPINQWSFVALVVTPTNATISMMNTNGLVSSTQVYPHAVATFAGTTMIGDNPSETAGSLTFLGSMDEVAVYNQALTQGQLQSIFTNASGVSVYPPTNSVTIVTPQPIFPGQTAQFTSVNGGSVPQTYTWQLNGVSLTDGANSVGIISGSATPNLTISDLAVGDAGQNYNLTLITSNPAGPYTSSVPAVLTVASPSPAQTIYTLGFEASGDDWNTATNWSDGNPASYSAYSEPGSTYQIAPGTLERTPVSSNAVFPGTAMVIEGNGVLIDGGSAEFPTNNTTGELRMKESGTTTVTNFETVFTDGGNIEFPDLQLNGGQLDNGTSSKVALEGELDVLTNSTIYVDSGAGASIRSIQIDSLLTGSGTITYTYLGTYVASNDLIISGTSNTFSGQWNILQGTLLGNATNSLGTNTISIGSAGALETTYNINNPHGNLVLNGQMFLYTSNTFNGMTVDGTNLAAGKYTFAQLNSAYPANFPATWPVQIGSTTGANAGTGGITVLAILTPQITQQPTPAALSLYPGQTAQFTVAAIDALTYQWWFTNQSNVGTALADGANISGSKSNVLTISSAVAADAGSYSVVVANAVGPAVSSPAVLTILTPAPATLITMSAVESAGEDWNTGANWSDGNPASLSVYSEPGSTYEVLPGGALRTPDVASNIAFPGIDLIITNGAELLVEHSGAISIGFPDLQLNGGSMDNGADGLATVTGTINVSNAVTFFTDAANPPGLVVNFDVPGGAGETNYAGLGAYPDVAGHTYWNPVVQSAGYGTTTAPGTNSDGVTTSPVTLALDIDLYSDPSGAQYGPYAVYDNFAGSTPNTPEALESDYLYVQNSFTPTQATNTITNTLNNVPAGAYNLYLYGNDGGVAGGYGGYTNDWGTSFTVFSDVTSAATLSTSNSPALAANHFIQGADYVVFSNIVVGAEGIITFSYTANVNVTSKDYFGQNSFAAFNGVQLVAIVPPTPGPRPFEIDSLLTGSGTINYGAGDSNFESDLRITGAANTFSGQWDVQQGALLGSGMNSLGTNAITVGVDGALETAYNIDDTGAGLVLNGQMFLHQNDTFRTLTVNGVNVSPGAYSFAQLNADFPVNFPAAWPMQTGSTVSNASGGLTVLVGPSASTPKPAKFVGITLLAGNLTLSGANGAASGTYHLLTTTNLALSLTNWMVVTNGSFDGSGNFNVTVPINAADQQQFYSIESP